MSVDVFGACRRLFRYRDAADDHGRCSARLWTMRRLGAWIVARRRCVRFRSEWPRCWSTEQLTVARTQRNGRTHATKRSQPRTPI